MLENTGYFVEQTLFVNIDLQIKIAQEEVFGFVLSVTSINDEDSTIQLANLIGYGLAGVETYLRRQVSWFNHG